MATTDALLTSIYNLLRPVITNPGRVRVDGSGVVQPVSGTVDVTTLPLPTGASTSALQTTGNASLASIVTNTTDNYREQILSATDCVGAFTWSDFATTNQRVASIAYSAASVPGHTTTKTFSYTLDSGKYRLDSITWSTT